MKSNSNKKYVVLRNGVRVSSTEYNSIEECDTELNFWKRVVERWPDGSVVEAVVKENKHRVYNL